jgi:hypothetical protein
MTSILVNGKPFHYFHSDKLGSCRAILINPDENLALPPAPTAAKSEKSHVELIFEEIDLYEQENAKKARKPQNCWHCGQKHIVRYKKTWECSECRTWLGDVISEDGAD